MKTIQKRLLPLMLALMLCFGHAITVRADGPATVLVQPGTYDYGSGAKFSDGLMPVQDPNTYKWGYLDTAGQLAIPCIYQKAEPFSKGAAGLAYVVLESGGQAFLNTAGQIVFSYNGSEFRFRNSDRYPHEGMLQVYSYTTKKYGFLDMAAQVAVPCKYGEVRDFSGGRAAVYNSDTQYWGFVDAAGNEVIPCKYGKVKDFSEGLAAVYDAENSYWGFVDAAGNEVFPCQYKDVGSFEGGYAPVELAEKYSRWILMDKTGRNVIPEGYRYFPDFGISDYTNNFSANCGVVWISGDSANAILREDGRVIGVVNGGSHYTDGMAWKTWYELVDTMDNLLFKATGGSHGEFYDGYAVVKMRDGWGFIDRAYHLTMIPEDMSPYIWHLSEGFLPVGSNATGTYRCGYVDTTGQLAIPCTYAKVGEFSGGAAPVKNFNDKWGLIDAAGAEVLPFQYRDIEQIEGATGLFWAKDKNGTSIVAAPPYYAANGALLNYWAKAEVNSAISDGIVPEGLGGDYREEITRAQFAAVAVKLYEAMGGTLVPVTDPETGIEVHPFTDIDDPAVTQAKLLGLMDGLPDGTFVPEAPVPREQAVAILSTVSAKLNLAVPAVSASVFSNTASIAQTLVNAERILKKAKQ